MPLAGARPKPAEAAVAVAAVPRAHPMPSTLKAQSFGAKVADPFSKKPMFKTSFGQVYCSGHIPCVVNHGSIKNKLHWKVAPQALDYDPLLILVAEGLCETDFPFNFIARNAFKEMLDKETELGGEKAELVLPRLIAPLRLSLMSSDLSVVEHGRAHAAVVQPAAMFKRRKPERPSACAAGAAHQKAATSRKSDKSVGGARAERGSSCVCRHQIQGANILQCDFFLALKCAYYCITVRIKQAIGSQVIGNKI